MRVAITGASGLIGSALVPALTADGHHVLRLVRRAPEAADERRWDPESGAVDLDGLAGTDAIIHLAAAGIGDRRWTDSYKRKILESRTRGTASIARAAAVLNPKPSVLIAGSAIGYYGDTDGRIADETAEQGPGFAATVVGAWERAADPARDAGIRVVHPRSGIVVSRHGGAFGRLLPLFRLGVGGRLGSGTQYWSIVSMHDEIAGLRFLLSSDLSGPVNLTMPDPPTNEELTRALSAALHRPAVLAVPASALRAMLGEMSAEVLGSIRAVPARLTEAGFAFAHPDVTSAMATLTGPR
jgi:uncharacterized protein